MLGTRTVAILAILLAADPAAAHEAPSGWAYPVECCSGQDCRPRACDALEEQRDGGVRDVEFGQMFPRSKVRPSEDGKCHVCTGSGAADGYPICVFVVQSF